MYFMEDTRLLIASIIIAKKVMIMFRVDRDSSARMGRYTINHCVEKRGRQGWGGGMVGRGAGGIGGSDSLAR